MKYNSLRDRTYEVNPESFFISKMLQLNTSLLDNLFKGSTHNNSKEELFIQNFTKDLQSVWNRIPKQYKITKIEQYNRNRKTAEEVALSFGDLLMIWPENTDEMS